MGEAEACGRDRERGMASLALSQTQNGANVRVCAVGRSLAVEPEQLLVIDHITCMFCASERAPIAEATALPARSPSCVDAAASSTRFVRYLMLTRQQSKA